MECLLVTLASHPAMAQILNGVDLVDTVLLSFFGLETWRPTAHSPQ